MFSAGVVLTGSDGANTLTGGEGDDEIFGRGGADRLLGGLGNDRLHGEVGADTLYGGGGDDWLDGGAGTDAFYGGSGLDTVSYAGTASAVSVDLAAGRARFPGQSWAEEILSSIESVWGTDFGDTLVGSADANALFGGAGADSLYGGGGNDTLYAGYYDDGPNLLEGGAGDDMLMGGVGDDVFDGGAGRDTIYASEYYYDAEVERTIGGWDTVRYLWATAAMTVELASEYEPAEVRFAGRPEETDLLYGIRNIWAGSGNDLLSGTWEANELRGGAGADRIFGGYSDDELRGEAGNDALYGGEGDDFLWGGGGTDTLDGGEGRDVASYAEATSAVQVDLTTQRVTFPGTTWRAEALKSIEGALGGAFKDVLIGSGGANTLGGAGGDDRLVGGGGDDALDGGAGRDTLDGGADSDTAEYLSAASGMTIDLAAQRASVAGTSAQSDVLISIENATGGGYRDVITGSGAANVLDGRGGDDVIRAGSGNDRVILSAGADNLDGGAGVDTLEFRFGYDRDDRPTVDLELAGPVNPHRALEYSEPRLLPGAIIDLAAGTASFGYGGASGASVVAGFEAVSTGDGHDIVQGSTLSETIRVGYGENYVNGRGGADVIFGGAGLHRNIDVAGADDPNLLTPGASELLRGGAGDDVIYGGGNAIVKDTLGLGYSTYVYMTTAEDTIFGDSGDDRIIVDVSDSKIFGGEGADTFVFRDSTVEYFWVEYPSYLEPRGTIFDFSKSDGDSIKFSTTNPVRSASEFRFVGLDENNDKFLQRPGDPGDGAAWGDHLESRKGLYGYFRSGSDTVVKLIMFDDDLYPSEELSVEIVIKDFSGTLDENDIQLVWDESLA